MAKLFIILFVTLALRACIITAAPNSEDTLKTVENPQNDQADPKLNSELYRVSEATTSEDVNLQGQRQKRFYDYFDFEIPRFGSFNYNFQKRDDSQYTSVPGTQDLMLQILRRVQIILSNTRRQASQPFAPYPVPTFIPFYYYPRDNCACNTVEAPDNSVTQGPTARPTQPTITPPTSPQPPADTTVQVTVTEPSPTPPEVMPSFTNRMQGDDDDGTRSISFVPVQPKKPLSRTAPPVDHGSKQESKNDKVKKFSGPVLSPAAAPSQLPSAPQLPTNSIPNLCDGAVLTCCHKSEVTYDCFKSQGCPNPMSPDDPCEEGLILRIIQKFQYYYANRSG